MPQPVVAFQRHAIFQAITGVATLDYVYIIFLYNQRPKLTRNCGLGIISLVAFRKNNWFCTFETKTEFCVEAYMCVSM